MSYQKKTWENRLTEYAGRRRLTNIATNEEIVVDVERDEGTISSEGDAFSAQNMNDMEERIDNAFSESVGDIRLTYQGSGSSTKYFAQVGADTASKKRLGELQRTYIGTTTGGDFDCSNIDGYEDFTAENFALIPTNLYARNYPPSGTSSDNAGMSVDKAISGSMSYDPETGILTVPSQSVSDSYSYGDYWTKSIVASVKVDVYCYHI